MVSSAIINLPNESSNGKIAGFSILMQVDKVKTDLFRVYVNVFSLMWLQLEEIQSLAYIQSKLGIRIHMVAATYC